MSDGPGKSDADANENENENATAANGRNGRGITINTHGLTSQTSRQRSPSPLSNLPNNPLPRANGAQFPPSIPPGLSPTSPTTRDRGYSLRRALFTRAVAPPSRAEDIELASAGPSRPPQNGYPFSRTETSSKKKDEIRVTITAASSSTSLPPRPASKKKSSIADSLPKYSQWVHRQRTEGLVGRIETRVTTTYAELKRRIMGTHDIPPSKDGRHIYLDPSGRRPCIDERTNGDYIGNSIRSSRYTVWNFLPRQLLFQFGKLANFYFLVISILQMIPQLSTTGTYTTIVPLLVFISLSMAKEGYDDVRRYKLDKAENRRKTNVLKSRSNHPTSDRVGPGEYYWASTLWEDVKVGSIVKLNRDDAVPADIILLHSDGLNNIAYIETMALDGETNLKAKQPSPLVAKRCHDVDGMVECDALFVVEDPNIDLYNFDGRVTVDGETLPLTSSEIVYRGSILRNTNAAIGIVVNTGEECKIRMNANKNPRTKAPSMQKVVNSVVIIVVFFVLCLACICTIAYQIWSKRVESKSWYLRQARVKSGHILSGFIIMFNTMIPLSLYVSLEIIKLGQLLLMHDVDMYDPISDTPMEAHTTTINEELGQVSYIFSDKTGTLTDNVMRFRKMSVAGVAWLHDFDLRQEAARSALADGKAGKGKDKMKKWRRSNSTHFTEDYSMNQDGRESSEAEYGAGGFDSEWHSSARPAKEQPELRTQQLLGYLSHHPHGVFARKARFFLLSLALCHTCLPEMQEDGTIDFQAASPDELALVRAAQDLGYIVIDRAAQTITLRTHPNGSSGPEVVDVYTVLDVIEFSSKRKRMSIIVRFPDGRRCIFCKGADSVVMTRLKLSHLATEKKAEVERRTSMRKSLEAEVALRRRSEAYAGSPRNSVSIDLRRSLDLAQTSLGAVARKTSVANRMRRDEVKSWLQDRETDVDRRSVDDPSAYISPRASIHVVRKSFSSVSSDDEDYYDDMVDESLAVDEKAVLERCFQHIDDFATEGLRTLLYGYKFIDEQDYNGWKNVYHDATTSLVNRQELIEEAAELIERDFELAGATAIEDKLQKGVPETIDKLRRANIKMWMLTGDKRETAINIGHSCRLIKDYSKTIILDTSLGKIEQLMSTSLREIATGSVAHSVIVVDGQTLADVESTETLSHLFFGLAVLADSVICCRASPSQKALLVRKIRHLVPGSVTLAIGDGANDIAMIQEAHVGIGITGKEGLQAARISDYSIAQFRFLQKLLLVHGRWNYVRTGKYVLGTFWKEMLFYLTQALYQRWNGYSGTSFYESWSLSMFNTLFTSLPVIFLGVLEQDLKAATLLAVPELYTQGQRNEAFNIPKYLGWMLVATLEAMMIYFMLLSLYAWPALGRGNGIFAIGELSFSVCVIMINTKLLFIEKHNKTILSLLAFSVSIGLWGLWNIILCYTYSLKTSLAYNVRDGLTRDFGRLFSWWLTGLAILAAFLVFELGIASVRKTFWPSDTDVFQELERDKGLRRRFEDAAADVLGAARGGRGRGEKEKKREEDLRMLLDEREKEEGERRWRAQKTGVRRRSEVGVEMEVLEEMETGRSEGGHVHER